MSDKGAIITCDEQKWSTKAVGIYRVRKRLCNRGRRPFFHQLVTKPLSLTLKTRTGKRKNEIEDEGTNTA